MSADLLISIRLLSDPQLYQQRGSLTPLSECFDAISLYMLALLMVDTNWDPNQQQPA
jgi:hypothetical protein